ncbi:MAG: hypothetical protein ACXVH1_38715, partial [Solirubrobacteraceae bacterium]
MRCHRCAPDAELTGPITAPAHMAAASHRLLEREALAMQFQRTTGGTRTPYRLAVDRPHHVHAVAVT